MLQGCFLLFELLQCCIKLFEKGNQFFLLFFFRKNKFLNCQSFVFEKHKAEEMRDER